MLNVSLVKAKDLFEKGHTIVIKTANGGEMSWDLTDAPTLHDVILDYYTHEDGSLGYWLETQSCNTGKQ